MSRVIVYFNSIPVVDKNPWPVLRGYWFEVIGDKWYPLLVTDYKTIEEEHCQRKWREKVLPASLCSLA